MNEKMKMEVTKTYLDLIYFLDNGGSEEEKFIVLNKMFDIYEELKK